MKYIVRIHPNPAVANLSGNKEKNTKARKAFLHMWGLAEELQWMYASISVKLQVFQRFLSQQHLELGEMTTYAVRAGHKKKLLQDEAFLADAESLIRISYLERHLIL